MHKVHHPRRRSRNPWRWVPSLFFVQGLPYAVVMELSVIMYKKLGLSNLQITLFTSWLYLPWVIKPLWSPVVDLFFTKRSWIVSLQLVIAALFGVMALLMPLPSFLQWSLAVFWLVAFCSATQDIAIDGFYMLELSEKNQAAFIGLRTGFYRAAIILGLGALVIMAGYLESLLGAPGAWASAFAVLAVVSAASFIYHGAALPMPVSDGAAERVSKNFLRNFAHSIALFFKKKDILCSVAFLLLYRLDKAQVARLITPFLLDSRSRGGLGLTTGEVGFAYGTVGVLALTAGALLGGYAISRKGLKYWLWVMLAAVHVPGAVYIYLAHVQSSSLFLVNAAIGLEQFGYGFGFAAYPLYMILISKGSHKTTHFGIAAGIMALGMMGPGMFSGAIQQQLGYENFFLYAMLCGIPSLAIATMVDIPADFGIKAETPPEAIDQLVGEAA